ncbi:histidinol dehydrogenase [Daejeonella lutea]|uniref:Histidinol dehydrogenase n=1 Tax=Daejeonella lutea TaxID=572036 RepID=A0A1T5EXS0_9SPHI|nr:histidinol dehydrogenase [Daejeonella lutea]SKB88629.1 histidinol dehydrogenase [Daejeonella lutea]
MLNVFKLSDLDQKKISELCLRNVDGNNDIKNTVADIIEEVKLNGDRALRGFAEKFDGIQLQQLYIGKEEIDRLALHVGNAEKQALQLAYSNIRKFHEPQLISESKIETSNGVVCWRETRAIEKVGLYIPGGTAVLPSTFLMLGIPARIAGCAEIVVCSPPQKDGKVNPYLAYCAQLLNIGKIYLVGGAQAVAAMAYGTESIPKVNKIFGPGNQYVTKAKTIIQSESQTAIDMPAGPSEVLIIADQTANAAFVAADMLAQAEHGVDSQAVLVSDSMDLIDQTQKEILKQIKDLPRQEIAAKAIENSFAILAEDLNLAMGFSNEYAPEHLILATDTWESLTSKIINAGSVFLGHLTPESAGDYASGTNHTLPTSSFAKAHSGVSVDSFVKKITFQHITRIGIENLGPTVEVLAELEGLDAHKNAITVRLKD